MAKVWQHLGLDKAIDGDYGIEIECEGENISPINKGFWNSEADGSLRGAYPDSACEFVLKKPIVLAQVPAALDQLIEHEAEARFKFSFRTSVHVHVNAQKLEYVQLLNLIYTYLLLEQPLVNFCGQERKANRFCLRLRDAEGLLDTVESMFSQGHQALRFIVGDKIRYASINLGALNKYGSVEFRAMRGNMDKAIIIPWVEMLDAIKKYAIKAKNPKAIHERFREIGSLAFLEEVLGADRAAMVTNLMTEYEMNESYSLSIDLPYAYVEQEEEKAPEVNKPVARARKLPVVAEWVEGAAIPAGGGAAFRWDDVRGRAVRVEVPRAPQGARLINQMEVQAIMQAQRDAAAERFEQVEENDEE